MSFLAAEECLRQSLVIAEAWPTKRRIPYKARTSEYRWQ